MNAYKGIALIYSVDSAKVQHCVNFGHAGDVREMITDCTQFQASNMGRFMKWGFSG
jgi:hypothetical protein